MKISPNSARSTMHGEAEPSLSLQVSFACVSESRREQETLMQGAGAAEPVDNIYTWGS